MRRFLAQVSVGIVSTLLVGVAAVLPAAADTSSQSGNGLKVSPVVTNLTISPGESQVVTVYVQNVTKSTVTLQALVNDFTAGNNESGQPALLLDPNQYAPSHSLKRYVAPVGNFTLQAGEEKGVVVTVAIPKDAIGGGYYGAVRFAPASSSSNNSVSLSASVGSLILVKVPGNYKEDLKLASLDVRTSPEDSPKVVFTSGDNLVAAVRFQNDGDVQEQPFGKVVLKQGSTELASYEINNTTPRGNVLPNSIRKFTLNLTKVGAFGQYTIMGNFGYGSSGQLLSGQTTFYVIPLGLIIVVVIILLLIVFAIFGLPRLIRAYNQRVIQGASRR
jgi:hypothetical protein